jgi:hypothetical protein
MPQQRAALCEFFLPYPVGQEAEVPQPVEPVWRDVEHQPPQELHRLKRQGAQAMAMGIVFVAEGHLARLEGDEPVVRDGDAMGVVGEVLENVLGVLHGLFCVDHPLLVAQGGKESLPGCGRSEFPTAPQQGELALAIEMRQACEVEAPEAA